MNVDRSVEQPLERIRAKVDASQRLSLDEGIFLMSQKVPLHEVGELANRVRERINGNLAYYNMNAHLNPTNVCVNRCAFCVFRADPGDRKAYVMSDQRILARGREAVDSGCTE
ncbi:MAG: aminofutalosine synthase MqnE, partial [Planctomycetota bacterium]